MDSHDESAPVHSPNPLPSGQIANHLTAIPPLSLLRRTQPAGRASLSFGGKPRNLQLTEGVFSQGLEDLLCCSTMWLGKGGQEFSMEIEFVNRIDKVTAALDSGACAQINVTIDDRFVVRRNGTGTCGVLCIVVYLFMDDVVERKCNEMSEIACAKAVDCLGGVNESDSAKVITEEAPPSTQTPNSDGNSLLRFQIMT
ncbi:hypothetical protein EVAR_80629_1 [Eumeta japonica]|uniref:Uncharacterized protein n=1 Tax=Eumeta variegata TaxID=151549 RepID=A0A4C1YVC8_EUMVA|nr:hypothetical protein EVAR_80629_1 [Eumeta japonica]